MPKVFPAEIRERFLDLVCAGLSLRAAAVEVGVSSGTSVGWWRESGRMELVAAAGAAGGVAGPVPLDDPGGGGPRRRRAVTAQDRASIQTGIRLGHTPAAIAAAIGRDRSVVVRELDRNRSPDGVYHAVVAHRTAAVRRSRPKAFKLAEDPDLCARLEEWMDQGWSPGLIAEVLAVDHRDDHTDRVSHETIYQALYVQARGGLRADLHQQLSCKRRQRVPRSRDRRASSPYKEAFKISQRPAEVADRAVPGHWEGDLIVGTTNGSAIGTLVERTTRFTMLLHLPERHDAASVAQAMIREMRHLPEHLRRSITWDRGVELADYADIQIALNTTLYFCDPHSPWQRGTNENTNRLLRHWFAKGSDLSVHTAADLARVAASLNARPRPTLDLRTPAMALNSLLTQAA